MDQREDETTQFSDVLLSLLVEEFPLLTDLLVRIEINISHVLEIGRKAVRVEQLEHLLLNLQDELLADARVVPVLLFENDQGVQDLLDEQPNVLFLGKRRLD